MGMKTLDERVDNIETALGMLERRNRRLRTHRFLLVLLLAGSAAFGFKAATQTDSLEAKEIRAEEILVDEIQITKGTSFTKAVIKARSDGKPGLEIRSSANKVLLRLPRED